jgi:3-oxoacyl-[acyl-carrier-protein] synthase III
LKASICGIGTWLPPAIRANDAWPASFAAGEHLSGDRTFNDIPPATDPVAAAILERHLAAEASDPFIGSKYRHVADPAFSSAEAEAHAAAAALQDAGIDAADVDCLFSNAAVPERMVPSNAVVVAHRIGATRALAQGMESACASSVTQIEMARAYVESGLARVVVLTQSHLLLRTFPMTHPASPGLGDGATAFVVARKSGLSIRSTFGATHGEFANAVAFVRGHTDATDVPWWKAGGDLYLGSRDSAAVKRLMRDTVSFGAQTIREAAARANIDVQRIGVLISVQPRGFIPGAIAERLGLDPATAVTTYEKLAHLGACGPVFNLAEARRARLFTPGKIVAMYGQGAGFTRAAAILEA